jgi:hypothetical protein
MAKQNNNLHNQRNNNTQVQKVQDKVQESVSWEFERVQALFERIPGTTYKRKELIS